MKKLILNLILLFAIVAVVNNFFFSMLNLPYCWGNNDANEKNEYLLKYGDQYNTIFIGSSKTYNQTDVSLFDSLTNHRTKSFNFGTIATEGAEIFYYTDNVIRLHKNIKYAFIEVADVGFINLKNLNTCRLKYYYNFNVYWFTVNAFWHTNFGIHNRIEHMAYSSLTFMQWLFKFDLLKDAIGYKRRMEMGHVYNANETGFGRADSVGAFSESRKEYLRDTSISCKERDIAASAFDNYSSVRLNVAYYNKLNEVVNKLKRKNIQVFLVIGPRTNEIHLSNVVPAFMKINTCPKINLADPKLNPEFYQDQYSFDAGHLNYAGARIYTERLAKAFNETMDKR